MKKHFTTILMLIFLISSVTTFSQEPPRKASLATVCLSGVKSQNHPILIDNTRSLIAEDFSNGCPPSGWIVVGDGQTNWQPSVSNYSGGEAPEAMFNWSPNFEGNSKLASQAVNTSGMSQLVLEFKHSVNDYSGGYTLMVETSADGTNWNLVWSENITGNIDQQSMSILIDNSDVGSSEFMFAFTFEGDSYNINQWYIDDVILREALSNDAGVMALIVPPLAVANEIVAFESLVINYGTETISFEVGIEIKSGSSVVYTDTQSIDNLEALQTAELVFDGWTAQLGTYTVEVATMLAGDENPSNDMMGGSIQVITNTVAKKPCFEEFTSSTCAPCATANPIIDQVLGDNPGLYTLVKYQMNWPGIGDPYYTEQGGVRRDYYDVIAVPSLYGNALHIDPANSMSQEIFDELAGDLTGIDITVEASIDQSELITVNTTIASYADYPAGLKVHIAVVEKTTYGNVSTNGEDSFTNVMMAMLPDAMGTQLDALSPGGEVSLSESYDMSTSFIEQANDLAVLVFVQDDSDKTIHQSEIVDVNGDFFTYSVTFNVEDSDGNAVAGAAIDFDINGPLQTNAQGQAVYEEVFAGNWEYEVVKSGLIPGVGMIEVIDQNVVVDVVLEVPDFFFFEDFNDGLPGSWTKYISSGNTNNLYWTDGFIVFWMQSAGDEHIILVAPELNLSQAGTLFFDAGDIYSTPSISIGTVASPDDPASFQLLETIQLGTPMTEYSVTLEDNSISDSYLAFKYFGPAQGYFYFDNVKITTSSTALPVPTGLTATVNDNDVSLQWNAPQTGNPNEYKVYRDDELIASSQETNYEDANLENGLYEYYVTAIFDDEESGPSNTVTANVGNVLVYCDAWGGCDQYISVVGFGTIQNTSGCTEYGDYSDMSTLVDPGETYDLSLVVSSASTGDDIGVWIDFDQNGIFDDDENLVCEMNNSAGVFEFPIAIPLDAEAGTTRMRIRVKYWGDGCEPCGSSTWGETEDYSLEISDPNNLVSQNQPSILVHPNPSTGFFSITSPNKINRICLYNSGGRLVLVKNAGDNEIQINTGSLKPGLYLCKIETDQSVVSQRLILQ